MNTKFISYKKFKVVNLLTKVVIAGVDGYKLCIDGKVEYVTVANGIKYIRLAAG